jgi:hypothetical protein
MIIKKAKGLKRILGLMFTSRNTFPLLFEFKKPVKKAIHSWFVFYSFTAYWLLEDNYIEIKIIKPFRRNIIPSGKFTKLLEVPMTKEEEYAFC